MNNILKPVRLLFFSFKSNYHVVSILAVLSLVAACSLSAPQSSAFSEPSKQSLNNTRCIDIGDQAQYFYESSGFHLPRNSQIILSCDEHSGFHNDGEYYIVFDTTAREIATYLRMTPWTTTWQRGPVPQIISSHTALSRWDSNAFDSTNIQYLADGNNSQMPFHNGRLLIIDLERNRVFYSKWDF